MSELEMASAALVALAEHGIPTDVQELLVYGNPERGIAPGAFSKAVRAVLSVAQARRGSMAAQWTDDPEAEAYYFAPMQAAPGPYLKQRHVDAIIDIAADGTLAGVELIDNMPPPPSPVSSTHQRETYCAMCDLEHQHHEDAQGFHHVIKGERVTCPVASTHQRDGGK